MKSSIAAFCCILVSAATTRAATNPVPNPGFEDGTKGWEIKDAMSHAVAEAAHDGKMGLRITDEDKAGGSSVMSARLPVKPGQAVTLTFWAKTKTDFAGIYLWFFNAA